MKTILLAAALSLVAAGQHGPDYAIAHARENPDAFPDVAIDPGTSVPLRALRPPLRQYALQYLSTCWYRLEDGRVIPRYRPDQQPIQPVTIKVGQILGPGEMLAHDKDFLLANRSTAGLAEGDLVGPYILFRQPQPYAYTTVMGATRTVPVMHGYQASHLSPDQVSDLLTQHPEGLPIHLPYHQKCPHCRGFGTQADRKRPGFGPPCQSCRGTGRQYHSVEILITP